MFSLADAIVEHWSTCVSVRIFYIWIIYELYMKFGNVIGDRGNRPRKDVTVTNFSLVFGHACGNRINTPLVSSSFFCFCLLSISSYTVMLHFVQCQMRGVWRQMQLEVFGGRRVRYARWRWLWLERQVSAKAVSMMFYHESCSISLLHCLLPGIERNIHLFLIKI